MKKQVLARYYALLSMLMSQFSIVLCYQPEFYQKCLELVADTLLYNTDEPQLKSVCTQLVLSLYQIDSKLLEAGVSKLDFTRKTPMRKITIEFENTQSKGRGVQVTDHFVAGVGEKPRSPLASLRDTQQSFMSGSILSPSSASINNGTITSGFSRRKREWGTGNYEGWNQRDRNSEVRQSRKTNGLSTLEPSTDKTILNSTSWLDRKGSK